MILVKSFIVPAVYPDYDWGDVLLLNYRPIRIPSLTNKVMTDGNFKLVDENFHRQRLVQSVTYNKYKIIFYAKENNNVDLLDVAEVIDVELFDGLNNLIETHHAIVTALTQSFVQETMNSKVVLEYYDVNPANYRNSEQPVNNLLTSSAVFDRYSNPNTELDINTLCSLTLGTYTSPDQEYTDLAYDSEGRLEYPIFTRLYPVITNNIGNEKTIQKFGVNYPTESNRFKILNAVFYLNEVEAQIIDKYTSLCESSYLQLDENLIYPVERIIPKITKIDGGIDLYKCEISMKYENLVTNNYE